MEGEGSILEVTGLEKSYGRNKVLKGVDLTVRKGEVIAIIGPSGCGKSTFIRCLNLLEEPDCGKIVYKGTDLVSADKKTRSETLKDIGMVFQQFNLFPHKTVMDNVTMAPQLVSKMSKEDAEIEQKKGNFVIEEPGKGYRRIVAAPKPIDILEIDAIRALADAGQEVIACGGGGIPVVENMDGTMEGVAAVIDKDFAAELLAEEVGADVLMILTEVEKVAVNFNKPDQKDLDRLNLEDAVKYIEEGQFAPGSMLPKVEAAMKFVRANPNKKAIITSLDKAIDALEGKTGTAITFA